jgi:hypothetical protein
MLQVIYISTATPGFDPKEVETILQASRRNNSRARITGLLVYDGKRFLQALEGDEALVEATYARISQDSRHRSLVRLSSRSVDTREFGDWAMAAQAVATQASAAAELSTAVDQLIANMPKGSARALFQSFARIKRAA